MIMMGGNEGMKKRRNRTQGCFAFQSSVQWIRFDTVHVGRRINYIVMQKYRVLGYRGL